jgi:hypothetical protein
VDVPKKNGSPCLNREVLVSKLNEDAKLNTADEKEPG